MKYIVWLLVFVCICSCTTGPPVPSTFETNVRGPHRVAPIYKTKPINHFASSDASKPKASQHTKPRK